MEFSIDKQEKAISTTVEMAFDILNKAPEHRTDEEDKWLKFHGGSQRFREYKYRLKNDLKFHSDVYKRYFYITGVFEGNNADFNKEENRYSNISLTDLKRFISFQRFQCQYLSGFFRFKPTRVEVTRSFNGLLVRMNGNTFNDLVDINKIFMAFIRWDLSKTKEDKEYFENIQKKLLQAKEFLNIEYPIPIKDIDLTIERIKKLKKEWKKLNKEIIYEYVNQKEKLKLIKKYKIDSNLSFDEVKEESEKLKLTKKYKIDSNLTLEEVKKVVDSKIRKKLGIGENVNSDLSKELIEKINKNIKNIKSEEGYLYIRTWKVSGNTQWYKIGITNDLKEEKLNKMSFQ